MAEGPYGVFTAGSRHGESVACFAAGVGIAVKAVHDILTPHLNPEWWTLVVLLAVFPVKYALFIAARRVAKQEGSGALEVDAGHHVADAITSLAAAIGISIALFGKRVFGHPEATGAAPGFRWETADDWAALFAAGIILSNAVHIARIPLRELMDASTPEDEQRVIRPAREVARVVPGVRDIEKIIVRKSGGGYWVDMHVQVDPALRVREAHAIGGMVRSEVRAKLPRIIHGSCW